MKNLTFNVCWKQRKVNVNNSDQNNLLLNHFQASRLLTSSTCLVHSCTHTEAMQYLDGLKDYLSNTLLKILNVCLPLRFWTKTEASVEWALYSFNYCSSRAHRGWAPAVGLCQRVKQMPRGSLEPFCTFTATILSFIFYLLIYFEVFFFFFFRPAVTSHILLDSGH